VSWEAMQAGASTRRMIGAAVVLATALAISIASSASANHSRTELLSVGSSGGNGAFNAGFRGASTAGTRVFFVTNEKLVAADTDSSQDVYQRLGTTTTLVSAGAIGFGNGAFSAFFAGSSADGTHVFFETNEKLDATDTDSSQDVYDRSGGTTTRVSASATGSNGGFNAFFDGVSADGTRVFFETGEKLDTVNDTDSSVDIYERSSGTTSLLSTAAGGSNGAFNALFDGNSTDGTKVFFETRDGILGDGDGMLDVFQRSGGTTTKLSTGPIGGSGAFDAFFDGASADGSHVFMDTDEVLTSDDGDSAFDVYDNASGSTSRVSVGQINGNGTNDVFFDGNSSDGSRVFFESDERLASGDNDSAFDVYERTAGTTTRETAGAINGNGAFDVFFGGISADGTKLFFESDEQLASGDSDSSQDVYERSGGVTTRVSAGAINGNGAALAFFDGSSADGTRVFFDTDESLVAGDTDTAQDLYERFAGATTELSIGPNGGNGSAAAFFDGSSADGARVFYETSESLLSADTDSVIDIYAAKLAPTSPGYDTPAVAARLHVSFVPDFRQTISSTQCASRGGTPSTHGSPLALGSCNPPALTPGAQAHFGAAGIGSGDLTLVDGDPGTAADEADLAIGVALADVRQGSTIGTDYAPSAGGPDTSLRVKLRISDTSNATSGPPCGATTSCPATVSDYELSAPINCTTTIDPAVGSGCSITTSADGLVPGLIKESRNTVLQSFRLRILDAGSNTTVGDADDGRMATQGLFIR
jgi:hypothetical protein